MDAGQVGAGRPQPARRGPRGEEQLVIAEYSPIAEAEGRSRAIDRRDARPEAQPSLPTSLRHRPPLELL